MSEQERGKQMGQMFLTLTRVGGQQVLVNVAQIVSVRDRAGDRPVVLMTTAGNDFEVTESFEEIAGLIAPASPLG